MCNYDEREELVECFSFLLLILGRNIVGFGSVLFIQTELLRAIHARLNHFLRQKCEFRSKFWAICLTT